MMNDGKKECYLGCEEGNEDGFDAIVVGSGYGGSVAACRMSMAGIKVCLLEKGRKWEAQDFPSDTLSLLSSVRFEDKSLGFSLGRNDALFQIHTEHDSLAATVCGLGGGSLVNAGVMLPTPVRVRRNPKWPKEWESDWKACEASASSMLNIQSVPVKFPNARTMEKLAGDDFEETSSLKLSINFDLEEQADHLKRPKELGSCIACGNCLAGCPYNAKNSTDKNYLFSAIEAGCTIKTDCQVKYVVKNPNDTNIHRKRARRWLVFLNETDYLQSDFVILSAGVFGTADLLFRSRTRGLELSSRLGEGFSCNGNNSAYLARCTTPLGAYGLHKQLFSKIPFQERPGPAISSSYTSSLGFTIQSAVLPTAYPYLIFKGISTYGWPTGFWFLHGLIDKLKHSFGLKNSQAMVLNVMGYDESDGKITFDKNKDKINFTPPNDPLLPRKITSFQKLTKKLGGILFMSRYRSTSVHLLGGCNVSSDHFLGVCNSKGQVFDTKSPSSVHSGLYVCDASLIPCSIGVNPCLTIATASEHVSRHLIQDIINTYVGNASKDSIDEREDKEHGSVRSWKVEGRLRCDVRFQEVMRGHIGGMPCVAHLKLKMNTKTRKDFDQDSLVFGKSHPFLRGIVGGYLEFSAVERDRLYIIDGEVDLCEVDIRIPYTQFMHYRLLLAASSGSRYLLEGKKVMNPFLLGLYGWKESTRLQVSFKKVKKNNPNEEMVDLKGVLGISTVALVRSLISMEGNNKMKFVWLLLQSIFRTYVMQKPRGNCMGFPHVELLDRPYPSSTLHEIRADDGFLISCRQWKIKTDDSQRFGLKKNLYPVLLINGHSTESFWLPTEANDLVRTLLDKGHETWLLQPRLHPLNSSNSFTIEDIGRFDIPAAIDKILKLNEKSIKIHVVAHCVGGLAIHIAIMGGHVSAARIASLSCTNSSMFFKLTPFSTFKMWLPLIQITMMVLGKNTILPLLKTTKETLNQKLLKSIARFIPRYERCSCDECEVFSGIFGNTFWHENITSTLHSWMNKKSLSRLPMAAFPHLRKICNAGFIVDSKGNNSYLIHAERMILPTLYISGGRTLLVTPQTSLLANKYMKLHHPGLRHERVVVEGFGHSDLLIGEESCKKVFPYILSHMGLAQKEENLEENNKENIKRAFIRDDGFEDGELVFEGCVSLSTAVWFLLFLMSSYVLIAGCLDILNRKF